MSLYKIYTHLNADKEFPKRAVEDYYSTVQSLEGYRVIYNEKVYAVVPEKDVETYVNSHRLVDRTFHEVITCLKQKVRWDVDCNLDALRSYRDENTPLQEKFDVIVLDFLKAIDEQANKCFNVRDFLDKTIICESSDVNVKFSAHIIIDGYYVEDNDQANEFAYRVINSMPADSAAFADMGVYKTNQNRCV